jgi:hypothetical protein
VINIVVIAICGFICGADDFVAIAAFGRKKQRWLEQFLDLRAGIPSPNQIGGAGPNPFPAAYPSSP